MMLFWALLSAASGSPDCVALDRGAPALEGSAGSRKIALVVGVGDYKARPGGESMDLEGPPKDALRIREVLVERYGFPATNVCLLRDKEATRDQYIRAWREHLGRANSGDTVVYYFAGHGSQTTDFDGNADETDGMDETILLHDSRSGNVGDLIDDEFNTLLAEVYGKTENITVLVDACNSGTATRGVDVVGGVTDDAVERRVEPVRRTRPAPSTLGAGNGDFRPQRMDGLVVITAAQDGTSALERNGQGVFTNALLRSLEARGDGSWEQIMQIVPRWIAAQKSYQKVTFEGTLNRQVFGSAVLDRGMSWQVIKVTGDQVRFRGPSMPGWTEGATLKVYDDTTSKHKARVLVDSVSNLEARGTLQGSRNRGVTEGDYALLDAPGHDAVTIRVHIADGVEFAGDVRRAVRRDTVLSKTVELVDTAADFYVRQGEGTDVEVWGAEGVRRNRLPVRNKDEATNVAYTLGLHARQASLIALSAEPNDVYPHDMLDLRVIPVPSMQNGCAKTSYTPSPVPVPYVQVPMCNAVQLEVTLAEQPAAELYLGILFLSNDGSIVVWPSGATTEVLRNKGDRHVEVLGWLSPPLDAPERILVFGSHEQVMWSRLAAKALATRSATRGGPTLQGFVEAHVGGTRGILDEQASEAEGTAWTSSFLQLQVTADPAQWPVTHREDPGICRALRERSCQ